MTTGVIMAAGRGSRMGRVASELPKCLAPLNSAAVLTHIIERMQPYCSKILVMTGYHHELVEEYVAHAHAGDKVECIHVPDWNAPYGGPGYSLECARPFVNGSLLYTSCDTLWDEDHDDLPIGTSWIATAPMPIGTTQDRWCRVATDDEHNVLELLDKTMDQLRVQTVYTGLGHISSADLPEFWDGLQHDNPPGEHQVTAGLRRVKLRANSINWLDVGDEDAYRRVALITEGYDWIKSGQVTYVLPKQGHVVKYASDATMITQRAARAAKLGGFIQPVNLVTKQMLSMQYIDGISGYEAAAQNKYATVGILDQWRRELWSRSQLAKLDPEDAERFYHGKTVNRVAMLRPELFELADAAVDAVDWDGLLSRGITGNFHGDLNHGNIIVDRTGVVWGIDWRESFGGDSLVGDMRYDLGKMYAGCLVHWENARRGDFTLWKYGGQHGEMILAMARQLGFEIKDILTIAALSLLSSAPLHAAPLDEVCVSRAASLLEDLR